MPDYINSHDYDLHLVGPDGRKITIPRGRTVRLPLFFERYVKKGYLKHFRTTQKLAIETATPKKYRPTKSLAIKTARKRLQDAAERGAASQAPTARVARAGEIKSRANSKTSSAIRHINKSKPITKIVGRGHKQGATESLHKTLSTTIYPVSNGIGVGILSFNRPKSLRRLINSIIRCTDLNRTTVFISDDGSADIELFRYLEKLARTNNFVILRNETRLGIAGNSNRLLRCLQRFPCKLLLNDDVEVLRNGWDRFYFDAMRASNMHHFCYNQPGVYGAPEGYKQSVRGCVLSRVDTRPHGAVLALDQKAFEKVGFFDESFGYYGMEHVDWSSRVAAVKLQLPGYWDVDGSDRFFVIHPDRSAVPDRVKNLQIARGKYAGKEGRADKIEASGRSHVPSISCVIPFRDIGRHDSILTAFNNIRAQRFPHIEMIVAEHDDKSNFTPKELQCITHTLMKCGTKPFNKSIVFNAGMARVSHEKVLLHDADTLAPAHYAQLIADSLDRFEACHFGARVLYADKDSTKNVNKTGHIDKTVSADKIVTYFEGGSLGCLRDVYWRVGGFVEGFWGYGCEDCDFYYRLSKASRWFENRIIDFIHLWHTRTSGWIKYHEANKEYEKKLAELSLKERILRQHKYLRGTSYARFVEAALSRQQP